MAKPQTKATQAKANQGGTTAAPAPVPEKKDQPNGYLRASRAIEKAGRRGGFLAEHAATASNVYLSGAVTAPNTPSAMPAHRCDAEPHVLSRRSGSIEVQLLTFLKRLRRVDASAVEPRIPPFLPIETKPLPAWLGTPPRAEPQRQSRIVWIVLGVALLFGFVLGGSYWLSQRGKTRVAVVVAGSPSAPAAPAQAAMEPPAPPAPQLAVGLPWLSGQATTGSVAAQSPVPAASQPPQLAVGLRPITGQTPPDAPAPVPAAETPPPAEPPAQPPRPHRKAATPPSSPVANPDQPSGFIKF
jgi:hypothetical protein